MEIERLGNYQEVDERGYLVSLAGALSIQPEWAEVLSAVREAYLDKWRDAIHSIYIRGSVAKGCALRAVSDIDSFAVTVKGKDPSAVNREDFRAWTLDLEKRVQTAYPYVAGVETGLTAFEEASDPTSIYAFMIKVQAVCIHGEDLAQHLPGYKPGPDIAFQTRHFRQHLDLFLKEYPQEPESEKPDFLVWMMRRFLRLGMELVMSREGRFTRDLYLCYESFKKYYPERQDDMYHALELAVNPVVNSGTEAFVKNFGAYLADEADGALDRAPP